MALEPNYVGHKHEIVTMLYTKLYSWEFAMHIIYIQINNYMIQYSFLHIVSISSNLNYHIFRPIRRTVIISLEILEKNNDECILILVIYWKKTGLLHTKISNHNIIYSS